MARRRAVETRERTAALVTIVMEVIARYRAEKERRGLLDYEDLIDKALRLLTEEQAKWVHYKLDLGIDHVLIDEAQDTSPKQWEIVRRLTAEFFAGLGAREVTRSIFAVGDEKQSIFSFQGAARRSSSRTGGTSRTSSTLPGCNFADVKFKASFRSAPLVLEAVDEVFRAESAHAGLTEVKGGTAHEAVRVNAPGLVELWEMIEPDEKVKLEGWDAPFDEAQETSPRVRLARKIAEPSRRGSTAAISSAMATSGTGARGRYPGAGAPARRAVQRGHLRAQARGRRGRGRRPAHADRAHRRDGPDGARRRAAAAGRRSCAGDRAEEPAVRAHRGADLHARVGPQEFAARDAAGARERNGLCRRERRGSTATPSGRGISRRSRSTRASSGRSAGARSFYARLGAEAADALDEFLELALLYERGEAPTLQGFVAWLRAGQTEVKRDMDIARDEVRVMTVHGAKGLEAPIVVLADTVTPPKGPKEPRLLKLPVANAAPDTPDRIVWAGRKADDVPPVAEARAKAVAAAEDEYRRLLYVAMTRAADRLVVAGSRGVNRAPPGCWYELIERALKAEAIEEAADDGDGSVLRWRKAADIVAGAASTGRRAAARATARLAHAQRAGRSSAACHLAIAGRPCRRAARGHRRPARTGARAHRAPPPAGAARAASRNGAQRPRANIWRAPRISTRRSTSPLLREVFAILDDARFASLFAENSRAEVPIVGFVSQNERVSGQVDRLAVTPTEVLIADYKSDRTIPTERRRHFAELRAPTGALSRRAAQALPESQRSRRAGLYRRPGADRAAGSAARRRTVKTCGRLGTVKTLRRDRSLTLRTGVHTFRVI